MRGEDANVNMPLFLPKYKKEGKGKTHKHIQSTRCYLCPVAATVFNCREDRNSLVLGVISCVTSLRDIPPARRCHVIS